MLSFKRKAEAGASPLDILMIILAFAGGIILASYYKDDKIKKMAFNHKQEIALAKVGQCDKAGMKKDVMLNGTPATSTSEADADKETNANPAPEYKAVEFDLEKASTPRTIGDTNAPVKISEHSSFTCGGCALFHANNYKSIKRDYIDTGKAYLVFDDFPRNQVDIIVGAAARCVPEDAYFNFTQLIFETQRQWAGKENFVEYIKQNAQLAGANPAKVDACLNSEKLKENLAERQNAAYRNHGVQSTPTLVLNDDTQVSGLATYDEIKAALDKALEKATK